MQNDHSTAPQTKLDLKGGTVLCHRKGIKIVPLNVNSLLRYIDEIRMLLNKMELHYLALNETKINGTIDCLVNIERTKN